ncbi:beta-propeller fold lactonase family protein, partial [Bacillus licheniformis]
AAYRIYGSTGELTIVNQQTGEGPSPCHVSVDQDNRYVLSANYHNGTILAYPLNESRGLLEPSSKVQHEGSGPHERQEKEHTHYSRVSPDEKYAV